MFYIIFGQTCFAVLLRKGANMAVDHSHGLHELSSAIPHNMSTKKYITVTTEL